MRDHSALLGHLFQKYIPCLCSHIDVLDTQACEIHSSKHEEGIKEEKKVYDFLLGRRITAPSHRLPRSRTVIVVWESSATAQMISVFALSSATAQMITVFALSSEVKCGTLGSGHFRWSLGFLLSFLLYCVEQKGRFHSFLAGELSQKSSVSGGCRNWGNAYMWYMWC